jgi:hypothetical protein
MDNLTKRDYYAARAPEFVPFWFEVKFRLGLGIEEFYDFRVFENQEYDNRETASMKEEFQESLFFAWIDYYSDKMSRRYQ